MSTAALRTDALLDALRGAPDLAVAVSGGVDSLTLATLISRHLRARTTIFHAVSPAVPDEATARVRALAARESWPLQIIDADEFSDDRYRRNPVNRCFHCKTHLYEAIASRTSAQILSGTNLDDLGEYRPGLEAAKAHGVRHPYVEAAIDKKMVRRIAARLDLGAIADLPAAPCLSSRIETAIAIDPEVLALVHRIEKFVGESISPRTVRCRIRASGMVIELDEPSLRRLRPEELYAIRDGAAELARESCRSYVLSFEAYRSGSAFLHRDGRV